MPAIVPLLEKEYRNAARRLEDTQDELNDLHPDKCALLHCLPNFSAQCWSAHPHALPVQLQLGARCLRPANGSLTAHVFLPAAFNFNINIDGVNMMLADLTKPKP